MILLDAGRNAEQFDTRDKIYALLRLMDPAIQDLSGLRKTSLNSPDFSKW